MIIKAIPTTYHKTKFRSKLEAHWAEWLDEHKIIWSYETQGFNLEDGTWYLPDFYLPEINTIIEVKGVIEQIHKPFKLVQKLRLQTLENMKKEDYPYLPEDYEQAEYNPDNNIMFLLAGPTPYFYNISSSYFGGLWIRHCNKCGKNSILTHHGIYDCRSCGDYSGGNHPGYIEDLSMLTKPLKWLLLERD